MKSKKTNWKLHRGRWRCAAWLRFVRLLPCCCGLCPTCTSGFRDPVQAHHIRYGPQVGMGMRPDDCLTLPLSSTAHRLVQSGAALSTEEQLHRLTKVWAMAEGVGFLMQRGDCGLFAPTDREVAVGLLMDRLATRWRDAFKAHHLELADLTAVEFPDSFGWEAVG